MTEAPPGGSPVAPRYGSGALSDLVPSVLSALGVPGFTNPLAIEPVGGVCVLVVDGLGWELLRTYGEQAPFLAAASHRAGPLTAGFPATTATSLGSLGTGLPPGRHGLVGYTFALPGYDRALNALQWEFYGIGAGDVVPGTDVEPEHVQPEATVIERAASAGAAMTLIGPEAHAESGLTRAILRGGRYLGADSLEDLVRVIGMALADGRTSIYAYHPFLDTFGHLRGVGSEEWLDYLGQVDDAVQAIAERLPPGFSLLVTADHGMVNIAPEDRVDVADSPELAAGVRLLAGEGRARHVYALPGASEDVLACWRDAVGDRMWVVTRDEAIDAGWFGPEVADRVRPRIGDVVAAAREPMGVFQRTVDPLQAGLVGHHGSLTEADQLVPCILIGP